MTAYRPFIVAALLLTGSLLRAQQQPVEVSIKNEANVNTSGLEFSPTFYEDGIIFISTNSEGIEKIKDEELDLPAMSILHSRRDSNGVLGRPMIFSKNITSEYHEGPVCFSPTGDMIYFSRNVLVNGKDKLASDGKQKMALYSAPKRDTSWGEPVDLGFNNGEFDDSHPSINIDGDKLYFASNRPGGYGGMDIYVAFKMADGWSTPVNLGDKINTAGNEVFPFIHADNTLYYASTGLKGMGGLDIFQSKLENGAWGDPVHLPKPFNTKGDDFGLIVDLDKINGYFSSNGSGGMGQDDIFNFSIQNGSLDDLMGQEKLLGNYDFILTVTDLSTGKALPNAEVNILNTDIGDIIGRDEAGNLITVVNVDGQDILKSVPAHAGWAGLTDKKGRYGTTLYPGNYSLSVGLDGYQTKQVSMAVKEGANRIALALEPAKDKVLWNATVFNQMTNAPLSGGTAVLTNTATGKRDTVVTDANGRIQYYLDPNTTYKVDLYQGGRLIGSTEVQSGPGGGTPLVQNISVAPMLPGALLELPNIYYNYNDASLRPDARKDLDLVVTLMKQHPAISVELSSHTDSRGNASYNQELSQRRANGVVEYLVTKGISRNRLLPVGHGESHLRNNCADGVKCSEAEHARNRRTEIKMVNGPVSAGNSPAVVAEPTPVAVGGGDPQPVTYNKTEEKAYGQVNVSEGTVTHYVIAGSFLMENRAQSRLQALKEAGYAEAEIIRFEGSSFYSVCVGRFDQRKEAAQLERRLETTDKLDAFIRSVGK